MPRSEDESSAHLAIEIHTQSERFRENDACLGWLKAKYSILQDKKDYLGWRFRENFENDVRACSSLRWDRFAFPSNSFLPLRTTFTNEPPNRKMNTSTTVFYDEDENNRSERQEKEYFPIGSLRITLLDSKVGLSSGNRASNLTKKEEDEWSRHIFEKVARKQILKSDKALTSSDSPLYASSSSLSNGGKSLPSNSDGSNTTTNIIDTDSGREGKPAGFLPFFGGYFTAPTLVDQFRFLIFPQGGTSRFSLNDSSANDSRSPSLASNGDNNFLRETPYYLRGSVQFLNNHGSRKRHPAGVNEKGDFSWRYRICAFALAVCQPPVLEVEPHWNSVLFERRWVREKDQIKRLCLRSDGVSMAWHRPNPRVLFNLEGSRLTGDDAVIWRLFPRFKYDSAVQSWREKGACRLRFSAGPGVELSSEKNHDPYLNLDRNFISLFGRLAGEAWVVWKLSKNLTLQLRGLSEAVFPYSSSSSLGVWDGEKVDRETHNALNLKEGCQNGPRPFSGDVLRPERFIFAPHSRFWATQALKLDLPLIRGFSYDYGGLQEAQWWYALLAIELTRHVRFKRRKNGPNANGNALANEGNNHYHSPASGMDLKVFANTCFSDSLYKYPRASLGFSFVSLTPRTTVDGFNKMRPRTFECSFNWLADFSEGKLRSGLDESGKVNFLRVSPVERFQHMRCGLTWEF